MATTSASPAFAASALQTLDPDKDGTVDLNETKTAASALFDQLDTDHDGTVDRKELGDRISARTEDSRPGQRQDNQQGRVSRLCRSRFQARQP
jgi:Ca2+-binding EF-hand superfamily protein